MSKLHPAHLAALEAILEHGEGFAKMVLGRAVVTFALPDGPRRPHVDQYGREWNSNVTPTVRISIPRNVTAALLALGLIKKHEDDVLSLTEAAGVAMDLTGPNAHA